MLTWHRLSIPPSHAPAFSTKAYESTDSTLDTVAIWALDARAFGLSSTSLDREISPGKVTNGQRSSSPFRARQCQVASRMHAATEHLPESPWSIQASFKSIVSPLINPTQSTSLRRRPQRLLPTHLSIFAGPFSFLPPANQPKPLFPFRGPLS